MSKQSRTKRVYLLLGIGLLVFWGIACKTFFQKGGFGFSLSKIGFEKASSKITPAPKAASLPAESTLLNEKQPMIESLLDEKTAPPLVSAPPSVSFPSPSASPTLSEVISQGEVEALIERWRSAWSRRDLKGYLAYYAPDFVGTTVSRKTGAKRFDYQGWKNYKSRLFRQNQWIRVGVENLKIELYGDTATATFTQYYDSSTYRDVGIKTLYLVKRKGVVQIVREESE